MKMNFLEKWIFKEEFDHYKKELIAIGVVLFILIVYLLMFHRR